MENGLHVDMKYVMDKKWSIWLMLRSSGCFEKRLTCRTFMSCEHFEHDFAGV